MTIKIINLVAILTFFSILASCTRSVVGDTIYEAPMYPENTIQTYDDLPYDYVENFTCDILTDTQNIYAINQLNNLQFGGFALFLDDNIYFADNKGIYKTDTSFEYIHTLVLNPHFPDARTHQETVFGQLQHHNDRIYFLNRLQNSIYSMNPDGTDTIEVLCGTSIDKSDVNSFITEFITIGDIIYFNLWRDFGVGHRELGVRLKMFDTLTDEITDFGLNHTPILSLSPDRNSLQFNHEIGNLVRMNLNDGEVTSAMPINMDEINAINNTSFIVYSTVSEDYLFFGHGQRIFAMGGDMYAREILFIENGGTFGYVNTLGNWIYFTAWCDHERELGLFTAHLYRVSTDGNVLELVYENIVSGDDSWPHAFFNIVCEDIIFFKWSTGFHEIYALVRDPDTNNFSTKLINPIVADPPSYPIPTPTRQPEIGTAPEEQITYPTPTPQPETQTIDLQDILGHGDDHQAFAKWRHLFGTQIDYTDIGMDSTYFFENGIRVGVSETFRDIVWLVVDLNQISNPSSFSLCGINGTSSYKDVIELFGSPPHYENTGDEEGFGAITSYGYRFLEDSRFAWFYFDANGRVVAMSLFRQRDGGA